MRHRSKPRALGVIVTAALLLGPSPRPPHAAQAGQPGEVAPTDDQVRTAVLRLADDRTGDGPRLEASRQLAAAPLPALTRVLLPEVGHGGPAQRRVVRETFGRRGGAAVPGLVEALGDASLPLRRADLVAALGQAAAGAPDADRGAAAAALAKQQAKSTFEVEARVIEAWGRLGGAEALTALGRAAADPDPVVRHLAVEALAKASRTTPAGMSASVRTSFEKAILDRDPRVRQTAARALAEQAPAGDPATSARLIAAAKNEPWPFVRRSLVAAIGTICAADGPPLLIRALERDLPAIRRAAVEGLGGCARPSATAALLALLERDEEDPSLRLAAAEGLIGRGGTPSQKLVAALHQFIVGAGADPAQEGIAVAALATAARLPAGAATEVATAALASPKSVVRNAALGVLDRHCEAPAARVGLERASRDTDPRLAASAAQSLTRCAGSSNARPP